jgi:hypothetical protein
MIRCCRKCCSDSAGKDTRLGVEPIGSAPAYSLTARSTNQSMPMMLTEIV